MISVELPFKIVDGFIRSEEYCNYLKLSSCCACGAVKSDYKDIVPHHTEAGGMSTKCDDTKAIPLCPDCHDEVHKGKETFYEKHAIDIYRIMFLYLNGFMKFYIKQQEYKAILRGRAYDGKQGL